MCSAVLVIVESSLLFVEKFWRDERQGWMGRRGVREVVGIPSDLFKLASSGPGRHGQGRGTRRAASNPRACRFCQPESRRSLLE